MRAAVLYDVDDIRVEERPVPELRDGDVLVRTMASGICTSDIMGWYVKRKAPLVLGHEPAGVVAAVKGASDFSVGDRVFVHHHAPCFACRECERGDFVQCTTWRATKIEPGGMAEYFRVAPENQRDTLRLPENVAFKDAALVEPLACAIKSIRRSGLQPNDKLYVLGLGVMGLMHVLLGYAHKAQVGGGDLLESRIDLAESTMGLHAGDPSDAEYRTQIRADVVICCPSSAQALTMACEAAAPGGTVVMFTPLPPESTVLIDWERFYFKDLRLVASYSCGPNDTREALNMIARGSMRTELLHATLVTLDEVPSAYRDLAAARILKPIVVFDEEKS